MGLEAEIIQNGERSLEIRVLSQSFPITLPHCGDLYHFLLVLQPPITGKVSHLGCLTINYDAIEQPLLLLQGICSNLGLELGVNFHLAINCAGHELMDYVSLPSAQTPGLQDAVFKLEFT